MASLLQEEILVLDGGLGTTLEDQHNVKFSIDTPLWSSQLLITDPSTLIQVQTNFVNAGANILLTPTYQASREGFRKSGISDATDYLQQAVDISFNASKGHALVALSLGAYGAILQPSQEYSGNYDINEQGLFSFHADRLSQYDPCWSKIDLVAFETLPRLDEIRAVKRAYTESKPHWLSCVFPNDDGCLPDGTSIEMLLPVLMEDPKPWAIGLNCTKVHKVANLVRQFENVAETLGLNLPRLVIYPDGTNGLKYDPVSKEWVGKETEGPPWDDQVIEIVRSIRSRRKWKGIVVGGCCKTTPQHIAKLSGRIRSMMLSGGS